MKQRLDKWDGRNSDGSKWVRKQHLCPDCKRVIRWRKEHDEWIALDLSGGDHAKYCEPPRWEPLGPPRNWQGGKR